jgi:hypothetical protein
MPLYQAPGRLSRIGMEIGALKASGTVTVHVKVTHQLKTVMGNEVTTHVMSSHDWRSRNG